MGPCNISADNTSAVNPYSWSEVSNLLFLSQPLGVGFSYNTTEVATPDNYNPDTGTGPIDTGPGRYVGENIVEETCSHSSDIRQ